MKKTAWFLVLAIMFAMSAVPGYSQSNPEECSVQVEASVQASPPQIVLHWNANAQAQHFYISRRSLGDPTWSAIKTLPGTDTAYGDLSVKVGIEYEYRIIDSVKSDSVYAATGFLASGIEVQPPADRGTVILIVDKTYTTVLKKEIDQLIADIVAEGRHVLRHDVNRTDAVTDIQATINNDFTSDPNPVTVFLLGHVPVPYSGDLAPDGHTPGNGNHQGAWPADVYYGNFNTNWTDNVVHDSTGQDQRNWNGIGDGKFDQSELDPGASMDLEVGRVDLFGLPSFTQSDTVLLRQYLNRDHTFRIAGTHAPVRALIDDNFAIIPEGFQDTTGYVKFPRTYDSPASDGWRNFPPLVGRSNVNDLRTVSDTAFSKATDWFGYLDTAEYLWAFGCGAGSWASCNGVGVTSQFANAGAKAIFYMVFGSFFGDWDRPDAFTKAPLGTDFALESCWAGRPYWYFHPLGMGETFGYCTKLSQDVNGTLAWGIGAFDRHIVALGDYLVCPSMTGVHVALMGDPTLRMQYLSDPPTALSASLQNGVHLTWTAPKISVPGYNVYRASSATGMMQKLNTAPVPTPSFTDATPMNDSNIYTVRAVGLETTSSGTYYDESGGVTLGIKLTISGVLEIAQTVSRLTINRDGENLNIGLSQESSSTARLSIVDIAGREIAMVHDGPLTTGSYNYRVNTATYASGVYFVRLVGGDGVKTEKILIVR